ncbi:MAG: hypothetical protein Greene071436_253 [Parcubacteria group bacterium Greene0714_36]|nr:MAG: hypothetical protein Greene071436_253 [Parcubacteria group bacterium Greene0714_36]
MTITKCDLCKKEMQKGTGVRISTGENVFLRYELCASCSKPIKPFLDKREKKINAAK